MSGRTDPQRPPGPGGYRMPSLSDDDSDIPPPPPPRSVPPPPPPISASIRGRSTSVVRRPAVGSPAQPARPASAAAPFNRPLGGVGRGIAPAANVRTTPLGFQLPTTDPSVLPAGGVIFDTPGYVKPQSSAAAFREEVLAQEHRTSPPAFAVGVFRDKAPILSGTPPPQHAFGSSAGAFVPVVPSVRPPASSSSVIPASSSTQTAAIGSSSGPTESNVQASSTASIPAETDEIARITAEIEEAELREQQRQIQYQLEMRKQRELLAARAEARRSVLPSFVDTFGSSSSAVQRSSDGPRASSVAPSGSAGGSVAHSTQDFVDPSLMMAYRAPYTVVEGGDGIGAVINMEDVDPMDTTLTAATVEAGLLTHEGGGSGLVERIHGEGSNESESANIQSMMARTDILEDRATTTASAGVSPEYSPVDAIIDLAGDTTPTAPIEAIPTSASQQSRGRGFFPRAPDTMPAPTACAPLSSRRPGDPPALAQLPLKKRAGQTSSATPATSAARATTTAAPTIARSTSAVRVSVAPAIRTTAARASSVAPAPTRTTASVRAPLASPAASSSTSASRAHLASPSTRRQHSPDESRSKQPVPKRKKEEKPAPAAAPQPIVSRGATALVGTGEELIRIRINQLLNRELMLRRDRSEIVDNPSMSHTWTQVLEDDYQLQLDLIQAQIASLQEPSIVPASTSGLRMSLGGAAASSAPKTKQTAGGSKQAGTSAASRAPTSSTTSSTRPPKPATTSAATTTSAAASSAITKAPKPAATSAATTTSATMRMQLAPRMNIVPRRSAAPVVASQAAPVQRTQGSATAMDASQTTTTATGSSVGFRIPRVSAVPSESEPFFGSRQAPRSTSAATSASALPSVASMAGAMRGLVASAFDPEYFMTLRAPPPPTASASVPKLKLKIKPREASRKPPPDAVSSSLLTSPTPATTRQVAKKRTSSTPPPVERASRPVTPPNLRQVLENVVRAPPTALVPEDANVFERLQVETGQGQKKRQKRSASGPATGEPRSRAPTLYNGEMPDGAYHVLPLIVDGNLSRNLCSHAIHKMVCSLSREEQRQMATSLTEMTQRQLTKASRSVDATNTFYLNGDERHGIRQLLRDPSTYSLTDHLPAKFQRPAFVRSLEHYCGEDEEVRRGQVHKGMGYNPAAAEFARLGGAIFVLEQEELEQIRFLKNPVAATLDIKTFERPTPIIQPAETGKPHYYQLIVPDGVNPDVTPGVWLLVPLAKELIPRMLKQPRDMVQLMHCFYDFNGQNADDSEAAKGWLFQPSLHVFVDNHRIRVSAELVDEMQKSKHLRNWRKIHQLVFEFYQTNYKHIIFPVFRHVKRSPLDKFQTNIFLDFFNEHTLLRILKPDMSHPTVETGTSDICVGPMIPHPLTTADCFLPSFTMQTHDCQMVYLVARCNLEKQLSIEKRLYKRQFGVDQAATSASRKKKTQAKKDKEEDETKAFLGPCGRFDEHGFLFYNPDYLARAAELLPGESNVDVGMALLDEGQLLVKGEGAAEIRFSWASNSICGDWVEGLTEWLYAIHASYEKFAKCDCGQLGEMRMEDVMPLVHDYGLALQEYLTRPNKTKQKVVPSVPAYPELTCFQEPIYFTDIDASANHFSTSTSDKRRHLRCQNPFGRYSDDERRFLHDHAVQRRRAIEYPTAEDDGDEAPIPFDPEVLDPDGHGGDFDAGYPDELLIGAQIVQYSDDETAEAVAEEETAAMPEEEPEQEQAEFQLQPGELFDDEGSQPGDEQPEEGEEVEEREVEGGEYEDAQEEGEEEEMGEIEAEEEEEHITSEEDWADE